MDLGGWLRSLGLDQYEATFRANEIDTDVLPELTETDLEKLGLPLGHRKRLLKAIAGLGAAEKLPPTLGSAPARPDTDAAERRQVTVMFSDLVGSTALSARMDPEDLREVISAYQQCVAETVRRFGGFVAKYMGDGVLVYFGYPQAHEDDAERAVRAGLELIAAVTGLKTRAALQTRVGIATGLVVVGDLVGSGDAQERGIIGETPNLAARLQGIAEPNTVVIAEGTRKLLGNLFELEDLGAKDLKGIAGPVRSLARSALVEAAEQLTRALDQIASLPATPALRREQIKLQVALINPLMHVKGYAAAETKAAVERARLLIEQAEALGEPPEDPLMLFLVLFGFWVANYVAFNGDVMRELAAQFLALAEKQGATVPLIIGHRLMGVSLLETGDIVQGRAHFDQGIALYDPAKHRQLATRFGQDAGVSALCFRSLALGMLGYPEAALADADHALKVAREISQAPTLMFALSFTTLTRFVCGNYAAANAVVDELVALSDEKGALFWKVFGMLARGGLFALTGKASDAVHMITSGITAFRSTGATVWSPVFLSYLAMAHADLGQFDAAWRCIGEAITAVETTKERWCEADIHRTAGEIALLSR